jgi:Icc protein
VDAIALTGDLVQDDAGAYGSIELLFDRCDAPVLLIPGNHDLPDEMRRRLDRAPFQQGGRIDLGAWTVLLLSTWYADSSDGEGRLGREQLEALEARLLELRSRHVLVCLHHPPILMDSPGLDALGLLDAAAFMSCIGRHPRVRGVVFGHAHQALDLYRDGLRLMCTPATCMQFGPRQPGFVVDDRPPGYRVIDLYEDGGIASEVIWLEGYAQ